MNIQQILDKIADLPEQRSGELVIPPKELVAFVVRWNRMLRQWKVSTLADFAQISVSTIERVERGESVGNEALDSIAAAFGYEPGYFTRPREALSPDEVAFHMAETYGNLETVAVSPLNNQRLVRDLAQCDASLIHCPFDVPEDCKSEIRTLQELLDFASFALSELSARLPKEAGRRSLYDIVLAHVSGLERLGLVILGGVMPAPQPGIPDWKVAVVAVTPRSVDPGAAKRRSIFVDRRAVALREVSETSSEQETVKPDAPKCQTD